MNDGVGRGQINEYVPTAAGALLVTRARSVGHRFILSLCVLP